jgi:hypothetical protein
VEQGGNLVAATSTGNWVEFSGENGTTYSVTVIGTYKTGDDQGYFFIQPNRGVANRAVTCTISDIKLKKYGTNTLTRERTFRF